MGIIFAAFPFRMLYLFPASSTNLFLEIGELTIVDQFLFKLVAYCAWPYILKLTFTPDQFNYRGYRQDDRSNVYNTSMDAQNYAFNTGLGERRQITAWTRDKAIPQSYSTMTSTEMKAMEERLNKLGKGFMMVMITDLAHIFGFFIIYCIMAYMYPQNWFYVVEKSTGLKIGSLAIWGVIEIVLSLVIFIGGAYALAAVHPKLGIEGIIEMSFDHIDNNKAVFFSLQFFTVFMVIYAASYYYYLTIR
jgi:hypothetical protein